MVAVRSAGLSFDSIIGYQSEDGRLVSLVDEEYLHVLMRIANQRFQTNTERISKFRGLLNKGMGDSS
jgi:tRNA wybutosine-synthesizing protein 3